MSPRRAQVRDLLIRVDGDTKTPPGRQLEKQLREAIRSRRLAAGEQLPSTRMLAQDLGISRGVVVRAYAQLAAEGYLLVRQGSNPRVSLDFSQREWTPAEQPQEERRWRFDLRPEHPDLSQFPRHEWSRSLRSALQSASDSDLGHIARCGLPQVRAEIAAYLARVRGCVVDPDRVHITAGSTHALALIARTLRRQGHGTIAFENPTRLLFPALVHRQGLEPVGFPVDNEGVLVEELERSDVRCAVVSPGHQFPLGVELTAARRTQLLDWAERRDCIVVEDDEDADFRYDRTPVSCLQGLAPERVVYVGSICKTLAAGLRLGWVVLPASLIEPVKAELWASNPQQSAVEQLALADFIERGEFDRHIRRIRAVYRRRRDAAVRTLAEDWPDLPLQGVAAGLHLVAALTGEEEEEKAQRKALADGIAIETLTQHSLRGYNGPRGILIGFGAVPEPTIPHAIRSLIRALYADVPSSRKGGESKRTLARRPAWKHETARRAR